jgi:hypothetical protein
VVLGRGEIAVVAVGEFDGACRPQGALLLDLQADLDERFAGVGDNARLSPGIEVVKLPGYLEAVLNGVLEIRDGGDNVSRVHVPAWVVILVDREDPGVVLVLIVQGTEILRILGDKNEPVPLSIVKMNRVGFRGDSGVRWPNHGVPCLGEQLGKKV